MESIFELETDPTYASYFKFVKDLGDTCMYTCDILNQRSDTSELDDSELKCLSRPSANKRNMCEELHGSSRLFPL